MTATAQKTTDDYVAPSGLRLFLSVRPIRRLLVAVIILGGLAAWFGTAHAPIPAAENDPAPVPMWRLLVVAAAMLPVLSLHSPLDDLEQVATRRLRRAQRTYLAGASLVSAAIFLSSCALVLDLPVLAMVARSWPGWLGLALIAGGVLGWRLAWTLPVAAVGIVLYWGRQGGGSGYHWWEFSARPYDDLPALVLSVALLVVGLVVYAATPWRRRRWRSRAQLFDPHPGTP